MAAGWPCPMILGHRGASAWAPENTLAAFRLAVSQGADGFELDTRLTADNIPIVLHDPTLDRTTSGKGPVRRASLAELGGLDAGSGFSPEYKNEPLPALEQVFSELGQLTHINVELANYQSLFDPLPGRVTALVRQHHLEERVLFSSFNPLNLFRVRRVIPQAFIGLLTPPGHAGKTWPWLILRFIPGAAIHPYWSDVSKGLVEKAHRQARRVHVWTVNTPVEMRRLFALGVDGIITDDPALARTELGKKDWL